MGDELLYLPVDMRERDLIRWLRASPFCNDVEGLLAVLRAIEAVGWPADRVAEVLASADRSQDASDLLDRLSTTVAGLDEGIDNLRSQLAALDSRVQSVEQGRARPIPATEPETPPEKPARARRRPVRQKPSVEDKVEPSPPPKPQERKRGARKQLPAVRVDGVLVEGKSIPLLYEGVLRVLVDRKRVDTAKAPVAQGRNRVVIHTEPVHPSGKPFTRSVEVDSLFIEAHQSSVSAIARLRDVATELDVSFEVIEDEGADEPGRDARQQTSKGADPEPEKKVKAAIPLFRFAGAEVRGDSIPVLLDAALHVLVDRGLVKKNGLPYLVGRKRVFLAREPLHPSGREFFRPVEYRGFYCETHYSVKRGVATLKKLLGELGVAFEVEET